MKFSTTIATAILGFSSSILAAPVTQARDNSHLIPDVTSLYHGYGGKIEYAVPKGKVSRVQSGNDDISTLVTFYFGSATQGKTCQFNFELNDPGYVINGDNIDVFRSSQYPTSNSPGWGPPSNYRDVQLGRMKVVAGGSAVPQWGSFQFPCPTGQSKGFEVTPTGDKMSVEWVAGVDGPWISYW
ncbi:hypothetical protein BCR34DRAFT_225961 [Clohesyomyces aquaticus]|uniref:Ubiquitin 3 binding protein But2 C-terminal domain-containing protein n=1 Tax=Clohesyomyces aquaticus TaxID=1231657 RepID=A0A1Y1Y8F5_9PLEO|nr:hypothetical protein BCR34DRAFT_225961 [Clohesyomyces aquaticus]